MGGAFDYDMKRLLRRVRQRFCRHEGKRVWDASRRPDGAFLVRLYCPACGWRFDEVRAPDDVIREAAGENAEMRETMRRNLSREDSGPPSTE